MRVLLVALVGLCGACGVWRSSIPVFGEDASVAASDAAGDTGDAGLEAGAMDAETADVVDAEVDGSVSQVVDAGGDTGGDSGGMGPRCDFISECASEAAACSAALGVDCGSCRMGTFACGSQSGYYLSTGESFPCVRGSAGLDCVEAAQDVAEQCQACRDASVPDAGPPSPVIWSTRNSGTGLGRIGDRSFESSLMIWSGGTWCRVVDADPHIASYTGSHVYTLTAQQTACFLYPEETSRIRAEINSCPTNGGCESMSLISTFSADVPGTVKARAREIVAVRHVVGVFSVDDGTRFQSIRFDETWELLSDQ